jgi:hypothetical protein
MNWTRRPTTKIPQCPSPTLTKPAIVGATPPPRRGRRQRRHADRHPLGMITAKPFSRPMAKLAGGPRLEKLAYRHAANFLSTAVLISALRCSGMVEHSAGSWSMMPATTAANKASSILAARQLKT